MAKDNNTKPGKPKFSSWWIYGLIIIFILGFQFLNSDSLSNTVKKNPSDLEKYLADGDVEKIVIISNARVAEVYLTSEALAKDTHKDVSKQTFPSFSGKKPNYVVNFGDQQNFEDNLKVHNTNNAEVSYTTADNFWGEMLLTFLPIILIIAIWIYCRH